MIRKMLLYLVNVITLITVTFRSSERMLDTVSLVKQDHGLSESFLSSNWNSFQKCPCLFWFLIENLITSVVDQLLLCFTGAWSLGGEGISCELFTSKHFLDRREFDLPSLQRGQMYSRPSVFA